MYLIVRKDCEVFHNLVQHGDNAFSGMLTLTQYA